MYVRGRCLSRHVVSRRGFTVCLSVRLRKPISLASLRFKRARNEGSKKPKDAVPPTKKPLVTYILSWLAGSGGDLSTYLCFSISLHPPACGAHTHTHTHNAYVMRNVGNQLVSLLSYLAHMVHKLYPMQTYLNLSSNIGYSYAHIYALLQRHTRSLTRCLRFKNIDAWDTKWINSFYELGTLQSRAAKKCGYHVYVYAR
ncbi:hypothetical protein F4810DRAFT_15538 [Camillea tinctor]|nr:hypothetical protein F4810DRAFT_15538 [Camillea tinctor]